MAPASLSIHNDATLATAGPTARARRREGATTTRQRRRTDGGTGRGAARRDLSWYSQLGDFYFFQFIRIGIRIHDVIVGTVAPRRAASRPLRRAPLPPAALESAVSPPVCPRMYRDSGCALWARHARRRSAPSGSALAGLRSRPSARPLRVRYGILWLSPHSGRVARASRHAPASAPRRRRARPHCSLSLLRPPLASLTTSFRRRHSHGSCACATLGPQVMLHGATGPAAPARLLLARTRR
jgi:hypothetical protein